MPTSRSVVKSGSLSRVLRYTGERKENEMFGYVVEAKAMQIASLIGHGENGDAGVVDYPWDEVGATCWLVKLYIEERKDVPDEARFRVCLDVNVAEHDFFVAPNKFGPTLHMYESEINSEVNGALVI